MRRGREHEESQVMKRWRLVRERKAKTEQLNTKQEKKKLQRRAGERGTRRKRREDGEGKAVGDFVVERHL